MCGESPRGSYRKLIVTCLLLALAAGYLLVLFHAQHVHGSALSTDKCVVCAWAKSLATIGASAVCIAMVCAAVRMVPPRTAIRSPFCHRLPQSARSPPTRPLGAS